MLRFLRGGSGSHLPVIPGTDLERIGGDADEPDWAVVPWRDLRELRQETGAAPCLPRCGKMVPRAQGARARRCPRPDRDGSHPVPRLRRRRRERCAGAPHGVALHLLPAGRAEARRDGLLLRKGRGGSLYTVPCRLCKPRQAHHRVRVPVHVVDLIASAFQ